MSRVLSDAEIEALQVLMSERVGYILPDDFHAYMSRQALLLVSEEGLSIEDLTAQLEGESTSSPLWRRFISRMTIGESYLFRNPNHMRMLRDAILPRMLEAARERPVSIWSAGCAMGQEPYTLAILLHELDPNAQNLDIRIIATDIDMEALSLAQQGRYGAWAFRRTPYFVQRKYFTKVGTQLELNPGVRSMVHFAHHHVAIDRDLTAFPRQGFDLVMCRNLLMYLREDFQRRAGLMLARRLSERGILLAGQVERLAGVEKLLEHRFVSGSLVYFKAGRGEALELLERSGFDVRHPRQRLESPGTPHSDALWQRKEREPGIDPDSREALKLRGLSNTEADLYQARQRLREALERNQDAPPPGDTEPQPDWPRLQEFEHAPDDSSPEPGGEPQDESELYDRVRTLMYGKRFDEAERYCQVLTETHPLSGDHHCLFALVMLEAGQPARAMDALRKAVYCEPDHLTAYYLWWLIGLRHRGVQWEKTQWARRHLERLTQDVPEEQTVPLVAGVTVGDIRYLLQRTWDSFER